MSHPAGLACVSGLRYVPAHTQRTRVNPDISPVWGIMAERFCSRFVLETEVVDTPTSEGAWNSGHPGPRPSGARCARVHLRSCSDVANLGQNIRPEAAKRTVVQTATLDTGRILHDHQQVTCEKERTGEISGLTLIEVLVSLSLLSLAAVSLSMAGMESMRLAQGSLAHSLASAAAQDLFAMQGAILRFHPELIGDARFDPGTPTGFREDCFAGACTASELHTHLQASWKCSLGYDEACGEPSDLQRLSAFDARLLVDTGSRTLELHMEWQHRGREQEVTMRAQMP